MKLRREHRVDLMMKREKGTRGPGENDKGGQHDPQPAVERHGGFHRRHPFRIGNAAVKQP